MEEEISLFDLAELDNYLDSIRGDISPEEYDARKEVVRNAFAGGLANCIPLSLAFTRDCEQKHFLGLLKKYPHDIHEAIRRAAMLYKNNLTFYGPDWNGFFDPKEILKAAEELRRRDQSIRSKGKAKKRKAPTAKSVTIAAMRKARKDGQTLVQFLASAEARSVEKLEITRENLRGVARYTIQADELSESARVALSTLEEWFTEAGKQATPD